MPAQEAELALLQQMRVRTVAEIARLREELQTEIEPAPAADDDAAADVAGDIYERSRIISLISTQQAKLHSIDRAAELAAEGTYGICEKCAAEIPAERLAIMPETTLCVRCASEMERAMRGGRRRPDRRLPSGP